jgi:hypothetical protein
MHFQFSLVAVAVACLLVLYSIRQFVKLPLQQGSHARRQFGILPLQQGSSAYSCMQFDNIQAGSHVPVLSCLLFDLSGLYVDKKSWILAGKD